jgi:hypothetical protein
VYREIHDRVSLRAIARISGPAFVRGVAANFHGRGRPDSRCKSRVIVSRYIVSLSGQSRALVDHCVRAMFSNVERPRILDALGEEINTRVIFLDQRKQIAIMLVSERYRLFSLAEMILSEMCAIASGFD